MSKKLEQSKQECMEQMNKYSDPIAITDNLIQAAQDDVWELIEKVLNRPSVEALRRDIDAFYEDKGWCVDGHKTYLTIKQAILESAKELEIK